MRAGRVRVNGRVVTEMGTRVVPGKDAVELDGTPVTIPEAMWVVFHKPVGVLTTRRDPHGGKTIYEVLPEELGELRYVGRLDRDAEGLLILTNDGEAAHRLQHPSGAIEREYRAEVAGIVDRTELARLVKGIDLEDGPAHARRADLIEAGRVSSTVSLVLTEGRKREVRRMLSAIGHPVLRLKRVRFGRVELGGLEPGAWRPLEPFEIEAIDG